MTAGDFYRVEFRMQNDVRKYYLVREIFSDAKKFTASRLITSGTPPTKTETNRCASLYGFDLELKCIEKAAKYRASAFRFDTYDDLDAVLDIERYRLLSQRLRKLTAKKNKMSLETASYIASFKDVGFTADEVISLFETGIVPTGKTLFSVNLVQNIANAVLMRETSALTTTRLYKIADTLSMNVCEPIASKYRPALEKRLHEFSIKIKEGFYPLEQCIFLYHDLQEILPDYPMLTTEVYARQLALFGYNFNPKNSCDLEKAAKFVEVENPKLEREIRKLNETMFVVKTGKKQMRLELF